MMKWPFKMKQRVDAPFLSPLTQQRNLRQSLQQRLPSAAAPIAVTLAGSLLLVVAVAGVLGGPEMQPQEMVIESPSLPDQPAPAVRPTIPAVSFASELDGTRDGIDRDPEATGSILSVIPLESAFQPAIAETEAEIAALEMSQRASKDDAAIVPVAQPGQPATGDIVLQQARITRSVNMRAGPNDSAEVLTVVPASTIIQAEADCNWCAVAYDGRSGYIYRSFISYE